MSLRAAVAGDARSVQIVAALVVDLLHAADTRGQLPCLVISPALSILAPHRNPDTVSMLRKRYPAVVRACFAFVMRPRTSSERLSLATTKHPACECDRTRTLVDDLHRPEDFGNLMDGQGDNVFERIMLQLLYCMRTAVDDSLLAVPDGRRWRTRRRGHSRKPGFWPSCRADVLPYGVEASMEALCAWSSHLSYFMLSHTIRDVCRHIDTNAYPRLLLHTVIPTSSISILDHMMEERRIALNRSDVRRACTNYLGIVGNLVGVFTSIDPHTLAIVVRDYPISDWTPLSRALLKAAVTAAELDRGLSPGPTKIKLGHACHNIIIAYFRLHGLIQKDEPVPHPLHPFRPQIEEHVVAQGDPIHVLATWTWHLFGGNMCGAPGCGNTAASLGRRTRACAGCLHMFYCSRACQRRAWRHAEAPHKHMCPTLHTFAERVYPLRLIGPLTVNPSRDVYALALQGVEHIAIDIVDHLRMLYHP